MQKQPSRVRSRVWLVSDGEEHSKERRHSHQVGHDIATRHNEKHRHQDGNSWQQVILCHIISVRDKKEKFQGFNNTEMMQAMYNRNARREMSNNYFLMTS